MLDYYVMTLGLVPYCTARTFLPLFSAALTVQLGGGVFGSAAGDGVQMFGNAAAWLTSPGMLLVLGFLAFAEVVGGKTPEWRELSLVVDSKAKAAAAFVLSAALAPGGLEGAAVETATLATSFAQPLEYGWAVLVGFLTWFSASLRTGIFGFLIEVDPDDDLGLQGVLSWLEDAIGFGGVLFVVVLPVFSLLLMGFTLWGLWLARRAIEAHEERTKTPCDRCGHAFAPCGLRCPKCNFARPQVMAVGLLGTVKKTLAPDLAEHARQLLARKRCPACGERLKERQLRQVCSACHVEPFSEPGQVASYLDDPDD
ncbi:MAG: hypothetical protein AAFY88_01270 [Acidobacteriota bacterium]